MRALARVGMFVKVRAIELREAEGVPWEMRGSPVQKNSDAGLVAAVDKLHEFSGRAVAARGGEVANRLIAPGAVEGMLHNGEKFDVRVAQIFDVGNELVAEFAIGEPAIAFLGDAAPGAEVNFVDGDG